MADRPMSVWLHLGPNSAATATVSFPTKKGSRPITLSNTEIFRLRTALDAAARLIHSDDGERRGRTSFNLLEGNDL